MSTDPQSAGSAGAERGTLISPEVALISYVALILLGGALVAPWLYALALKLTGLFPELGNVPFYRFMHRTMLGFALLGLWLLLRAIGFRSLSELGLRRLHGRWRKFVSGFFLSFVALALVSAAVVFAGARHVNSSLTPWVILGRLAGAIPTALFVATMEELAFRGGLLGGLRRVYRWSTALVASSAVFALGHFFKKATLNGPVTWDSGFVLLPQMLSGLIDFQVMIPAVFTLFLAGILFGIAYDRTGALYYPIGMHAGAIVWIKLFLTLTAPTSGASAWFWGTGSLIDGWLTTAVLFVAVLVFNGRRTT